MRGNQIMKLLKNFFIVVLTLVLETWTGFFKRDPNFYDKYTVTKTKVGYMVFVVLASAITIGIASLLLLRIN